MNLLLYKVKFGSKLYGTEIETSDTDFKGIFLPKLEDLVLYSNKNNIHYFSEKKDNVDSEYFSIQYWFHLLKKGEAIGIDILFSDSAEECIETITDEWREILLFRNNFINYSSLLTSPYIKYAKSQSLKYCMKGKKLKDFEKILDILEKFKESNFKLFNIVEHIIKINDSFKISNENNTYFLQLFDKKHDLSIKVSEFYDRIKLLHDSYGKRSNLSKDNDGIDYKALYHSVRLIRQLEQLIKYKTITFPLSCRKELIEIRTGKISLEEIIQKIDNGFKKLEELYQKYRPVGYFNEKLSNELIYKFYKLKGG